MKISDKDTLLFIGDSITDCGRELPVGEGDGLGNGYAHVVNGLLASSYPERMIRVLNTGTSGHRVPDLEGRWQEDVLDLKPDWLSIMIGVNDVWRHFDQPFIDHQVDIEEYESTLERLIERSLPNLKGLVILSPFFLESNLADPFRKQLDEYGAVGAKLAERHGAIYGDTQAAFDEFLVSNHSQRLCWDRVHPNIFGHSIIARTFLKAVDFSF